MGLMVRFMTKCYDCATLVEVPQNFTDIALCKRHGDEPKAVIIQFPTLCSSEEEHSPVEREAAIS